MIYTLSDNHFFHKKIIEYENRPFKNINEMNDYMIYKWNSIVKQDDNVLYVGDFSFANKEKTKNILKSLNGEKILIKGNHDGTVKRNLDIGFADVFPYWYNGGLLAVHNPNRLLADLNHLYEECDVAIYGHIHTKKFIEYDNLMKAVNVSAELWDYTPVSIDFIKKIVDIK